MSPARVSIDDQTKAVISAIQQETNSSSVGQAIALLVSRYGEHMLSTWKLDSEAAAAPRAEQAPPVAPTEAGSFTFEKPISL